MKIVVCIKPVPDSDSEAQMSIESLGAVPLVLNPFDGYALEAALQQKDALGATLTTLCIGDESAKDVLKHTLAMGADEAILLSGPLLGELDTQGAARVLAAAVKKLGEVQMLIFGRQTLDHATGLTPAQTARVLGWPLLALAGSIQVREQRVTVERSFEEGRQTVSAALPVAVSVTQAVGEPRYPSFAGIRKAAKASIPVWLLDDLGASAPVVRRTALFARDRGLPCEFISGETPEEIAEKLAEKILAENVL